MPWRKNRRRVSSSNDGKQFTNNKWKWNWKKMKCLIACLEFKWFSTLYECVRVFVIKSSDWRIVEQSNCHIVHNLCTSLFRRFFLFFLFFSLTLLNINIHNAQRHLCCTVYGKTPILIAFWSTRFALVLSHLQWHFSILSVFPYLNDRRIVSNFVDNNHLVRCVWVFLVCLWHKTHWCTLYTMYAQMNGCVGSNFNDRINS